METICILWILCFNATSTPMPTVYPTATQQPMPTMQLVNYAGTMAAFEMQSAMTQQAGRDQAEQAKLAAEQAKIRATQHAEDLQVTMIANQATARAYDAQMTAQAQETRAAVMAATQGQQTAAAASATAQYQPTSDMWTTTAIVQDIAVRQAEVDKVNLAVKRQSTVNIMQAWTPYVVIFLVLIFTNDGFKKWLRTRVFNRDEHGRMPQISFEMPDGQRVFVNPSLLTGPVLTIDDKGQVLLPQLESDRKEQSKVNHDAAIAEVVGLLPAPYAKTAQTLMANNFGGKAPARISIRDDGALAGIIEEADAKIVEDE